MNNVINLNTTVKNPSKTYSESLKRFERAIGRRSDFDRDAWNERINHNINYWKQYGKLPSNTDLSKVSGKGMYGS